MPRTGRASVGGICYHVLNRGNRRSRVFWDDRDYLDFLGLMDRACRRVPLRVLGYCLMPNHFHLVLWPRGDGDLSRWMHWLLTTHVRWFHRVHETSGRVWQGRFKAFPVRQDEHLLAVLRYVERNPVRAKLAPSARDWPWSSNRFRESGENPPFLHVEEGLLPADWKWFVNLPQTASELAAVRRSVNRGTPFGPDRWIRRVARQLGLESTLRRPGRPRRRGPGLSPLAGT
ncbi:MAG: transposase [Acidobacteria bacterium]|nr:transposase [Acidobacteriota bacterium]